MATKKAEVKMVLKRMKQDFIELNELWQQTEWCDDVDDMLTENYPFMESFDELTVDVVKWINNIL